MLEVGGRSAIFIYTAEWEANRSTESLAKSRPLGRIWNYKVTVGSTESFSKEINHLSLPEGKSQLIIFEVSVVK